MERSIGPQKRQSGFTLIELMITIAIVGILAAIAVPSYLSYTDKAKFSEVVLATGPYKMAVDLCAQTTNGLTACGNGSNGVPAAAGSSGQVASITVAANGTITATDVNSVTYVLTPSYASGKVSWSVDGSSSCLTSGVC